MSTPGAAARQAASLFAAFGLLDLASAPLDAGHARALVALGALDLLVAAVVRLVPWDRWLRRATLVLALPMYLLTVLANAAGILPTRAVPVLFVLGFVWVGTFHPPRTSLWLVPPTGAAYCTAVLVRTDGVPLDLGAVVVVTAVCVFVAETIARAQQRLRRSEAEMRFLVEHSTDVVTRVGSDGVIRYVSPSSEHVLGWRPEDMVGTYAPGYRHPDDDVPADRARANPGRPVVVVRRLRRKDGGFTWLESVARAITGPDGDQEIVSTARDITERKALEDELARVASHDQLTGLLNRRVLEHRLEQRLADPGLGRIAVAFIDLDGFKQVNDDHGHQAGDELLTLVAARLRNVTREGDVVARYGGDEFVVVLDRLAHEEDVLGLATRIETELSAPYRLGCADVRVGASVGVALAVPGSSLDDVVREADHGMYAVKSGRRSEVPSQRDRRLTS